MTRLRSVALLVAGSLVAGCSALLDFDSRPSDVRDGGPSTGDGAVTGDSATDSGSGADADASGGADADASLACPGTAGPTPVRVGSYCIDSTEVTNKQYNLFLAAMVAPPVTGPCAGNPFLPKGGAPTSNDLPVVYVDWCDALGFCTWAGKRLCANGEWYGACSKAGAQAYPYDGPWVDGACVTGASLMDVGMTASCMGGYSGLFDMSGNAAEWEDACNGSDCAVRGGAFDTNTAASLRCDYSRLTARTDNNNDEIGFRCCSK